MDSLAGLTTIDNCGVLIGLSAAAMESYGQFGWSHHNR